jgi:hypothetical protein
MRFLSLPFGTLAATSLLLLGACEGVKEELGLTKQSPDEFRVVSRAPLTRPPDYSLRPPAPGEQRPQEDTTSDQARKALLESVQPKSDDLGGAQAANGRSQGERALLRAAGAVQVDPDIRRLVDRETQDINLANKRFVDKLIFWREPDLPGVVVDADKEARRLKENAALGRDTDQGATPTIERRKKALLEGVL